MASLPEVTQKFTADTTGYSAKLREAAQNADKFGDKNDKAALAARKMGLAAKEAADKAARSMAKAGRTAENFAEGMATAEEKADAEARSLRDMERAAIKATEAQRAIGRAADKAAENMREAARAAELLAAAEGLGALKAAGATKAHNDMIRRLVARFGDLSKEGGGAFKEIESTGTKAFASIGSSGPGSIALVAAALGAVPFAATLAEGAITLGVGGALAGLGLAATKSDKDVQAALHGMTSHVKSETKQIAAPFKQTWLEIAKTGTDTFDAFVPHLTDDFAKLAPAVSRFSHDAGYALTQLAPAFDAAASGAAALMDELGPKLPEISRSLGHSIEVMGNASAKAAPQFANLVAATAEGAGTALTGLAHLMDVATKVGPTVNLAYGAISQGATTVSALRGGLSTLTGGLISADHSFQTAAWSGKSFAAQAADAAIKAHTLTSANQLAALSADELAGALNALTAANMGVDGAAIAAAQATKAAAAATDHRRKVTLAEKDALLTVAQADQNWLVKLKASGASADAVAAKMGTLRGSFIATARQMGYTAAEARALATRYGLLPRSKQTKVTAPGATTAKSQADRLRAALAALHDKTVHVRTVYTVAGTTFGAGNKKLGAGATGGYVTRAEGGPVQRLAVGGPSGYIRGPGTTTSDSIPTLLSDKEYVINAEQTEKYRPLLDAINYKLDGFASGGLLEGYAKGGKAKKPTAAQKAAGAARVALARSRPEYLASMAAQKSLESMRASIYGGMFRGGPSTPGSAHGTVVQHVNTIHVTVQGNVWKTNDLAKELQGVFIRNNMNLVNPRTPARR